MFGLREKFDYFECAACGTIQIREIPELDKYYPPEYRAHNSDDLQFSKKWGSRFLARLAADYFIDNKHGLGKLAATGIAIKSHAIEEAFPFYLREEILGIRKDSRILDFGAASGRLLRILDYFGFSNLVGADKFVGEAARRTKGIEILDRGLEEFEPNSFDLVMLHHVLEHMPDPVSALKEIHKLLPVGRYSLIRIPIASFAWEKYREDWYQLDAPRHLYLFREDGFTSLAGRVGFAVDKVIYDSTVDQFFASELYRQDIPLLSVDEKRIDSIFDRNQMESWRKEAKNLNEAKRGDQACFFLRKLQTDID